MHLDGCLAHRIVLSGAMAENYPRQIVEAALRENIRAQQCVLEACAREGYQRVHVQAPHSADALGHKRNPYTVWDVDGQSKLLASYYIEVTEAGVDLILVEGRRPDGRIWTMPEIVSSYAQVLEEARRDLARDAD